MANWIIQFSIKVAPNPPHHTGYAAPRAWGGLQMVLGFLSPAAPAVRQFQLSSRGTVPLLRTGVYLYPSPPVRKMKLNSSK